MSIVRSNEELNKYAESKAPLTGTGASGTWGISVTGNAGTVTNGVYTTGDQTITGVKTFSSSPIVPTPTTGTQAVNKDYVDNGAGAAFVANDTRVKTALNATGNAPIYACRAWVNFNGTETVAIRASGNVSSITDNGAGQYTVNFTTAMPDENYSVVLGSRQDADANENAYDLRASRVGQFSTTGVSLSHGYFTTYNAYVDCLYGLVSIIR